MRDAVDECEQVGYAKSLVDGLEIALSDVDASAPPGRVAALPSPAVTGTAVVIPHRLAEEEGITFVRCGARSRPPAETVVAAATRLGAVRIGVTRRLVERAVEHLSDRESGGEPIIRKQLVQGAIVDVLTGLEATRGMLRIGGEVGATAAAVHQRLNAMDWEMTKLLGASGYVEGSAGRAAYVARLAAHCWTPKEEAEL